MITSGTLREQLKLCAKTFELQAMCTSIITEDYTELTTFIIFLSRNIWSTLEITYSTVEYSDSRSHS